MRQEAYQTAAKLQTDHWWFVGRRRFVRTAMRHLLPSLPYRILEVGCGVGANLSWLANFGKVSAVEPDSLALEYARSLNVADVQQGSLPDDIPFTAGKFDVVVSLDVLEHVEDHEAALTTLINMTQDNGYIVLTVPAYPFLWSSHDVLSEHKRRYLRSTLLDLFGKAGLEPVYTSYFNTLLFPLSVLVAFIDRIHKSDGNWFKKHSPIVNSILKTVFGMESKLAGRASIPFGTTLLAVAQKTKAGKR
jgi:SAM-dependent methyltransferase